MDMGRWKHSVVIVKETDMGNYYAQLSRMIDFINDNYNKSLIISAQTIFIPNEVSSYKGPILIVGIIVFKYKIYGPWYKNLKDLLKEVF